MIRKVTWISEEEFLQNVEKPDGIKKLCGQCNENDLGADEKDQLPLYISIDKDILSESEGKTNWDQGNVVFEPGFAFYRCYMQQTPGRQLYWHGCLRGRPGSRQRGSPDSVPQDQ